MAKVELKKLFKTYNKKIKALEDINLTIEDGQFFVLLGPSGAGKTTLLQILGTIDKFDKNDKSSLKLCGKDIFKLNDNSLADFRNNEFLVYQKNFLNRIFSGWNDC